MDKGTCEEIALTQLEEEEPDADPHVQQAVAEKMCQLLDSGKLEDDIDEDTYAGLVNIEYLLSRLEVRRGDADLRTKWNYWIEQMCYFAGDEYDRYKI